MFVALFVLNLGSLLFGASAWRQYGNSRWYRSTADRIPFMPPSWVFSVVWPVMYAISLTANTFTLIIEERVGSGVYTAQLWLELVSEILLSQWPAVFFEFKAPNLALVLLVFIVGVGVAQLIVSAIGGGVVSTTLLGIALCWYLFALLLNIAFVYLQPRPLKTPR